MVVYMETKVTSDSFTATSELPAVVVPPCSLTEAMSSCTEDPKPLSVQAAFRGKNVLITGAIGFVGSVAMEQILRLCPDVPRIFLLIRSKAGHSGQERLETLLKSRSLFQEHTSSQEALRSVMDKLVVVEGDVQQNDCGLSAADLARLRADVDIVIHSAASISFFEHIHVLLQQNYQATKEIANLAASMPRLQAFIYVSTCYVNAHRPQGSHVEEAIFPLVRATSGTTVQHAELAAKLAKMPPAKAEKAAQDLLRDVGLPNSYTLTKHMAEGLVADMHAAGALPVAIVRPSIIGCIAHKPLPGYFGNSAGLTSAILAFASGMARFTCHDPHHVVDAVPCDTVASVILLAAAATSARVGLQLEKPLIVHAATSTTHPRACFEIFDQYVRPFWQEHPPRYCLSAKPYKSVWDKNAVLPEESLTFKWLRWRQGVRLHGVALGLTIAGQGKLAKRVLSGWKVWKLYNTGCMDFHLYFCCANVEALARLLPHEERLSFRPLWQASEDSWEDYMHLYMTAIRAKFYDPYDQVEGKQPAKQITCTEKAVAVALPVLIAETTAKASAAC